MRRTPREADIRALELCLERWRSRHDNARRRDALLTRFERVLSDGTPLGPVQRARIELALWRDRHFGADVTASHPRRPLHR